MVEHIHGATVLIVIGATDTPLLRVHAPDGRLMGWMLTAQCSESIPLGDAPPTVYVTGDINGTPYELIAPLLYDESGRLYRTPQSQRGT